ncbi:Swt21p [Saccharomyces paradoxus]|uniref:Protein SWT21 n=1 Tax=Saccharomyces paradoxus TaxID=27291 RepID=A0A8B8UYH5_SACPA|nr:Swt21 [Saccharomyces paradoxus]QHS75734.1 Swt21 [Saccharomyces paradoxus]
MNTTPYCDTGKVFEADTIVDVWKREDKEWLQRTQSDPSGYVYPPLKESPYINVKDDVRMEKKVLCQDIFWSCDGASFVSVHNDFGIRQYLVPEEANTDKTKKSLLLPFTRFFKNQSILSCAVDPFYSLYSENSGELAGDRIVIGGKNFPLQLYSLMDGQCIFSYDTKNEMNGEYESVYSVRINAESRIYTGSHRNKVAIYDMSRREAVWMHRSTRKASRGRQSIISCFEEQPMGGQTSSRGPLLCGSYANEMFQVDSRHQRLEIVNYARTTAGGILQILASDNGRYVYVVRRNSDTISVYDRRNLQRELNLLLLPFRIHHNSAKLHAYIDMTCGLSMGTPQGMVLNWGRDLVEFGGVSSRSSVEELPTASIQAESVWHTSLDSGIPASVVKNCPGDPELLALSHGGTISLSRLGG